MKEKLGVVLDTSLTKTGTIGSLCPSCGGKLEEPNKCNFCGTQPWEPKPEPLQSKK